MNEDPTLNFTDQHTAKQALGDAVANHAEEADCQRALAPHYKEKARTLTAEAAACDSDDMEDSESDESGSDTDSYHHNDDDGDNDGSISDASRESDDDDDNTDPDAAGPSSGRRPLGADHENDETNS